MPEELKAIKPFAAARQPDSEGWVALQASASISRNSSKFLAPNNRRRRAQSKPQPAIVGGDMYGLVSISCYAIDYIVLVD
jgi:hypothetical protein